MSEVTKIVADIKSGNIKPIYFLMGEEPYYIDKISEFIEKNVLTEEQQAKYEAMIDKYHSQRKGELDQRKRQSDGQKKGEER